jgi:predicted nucleic acid-binding protein
VENDVIFAYLNRFDSKHSLAKRIFHALRDGRVKVSVSSVSLLEMALIYRSEGREAELPEHLGALAALPNVTFVPLLPDTALTSVFLRRDAHLTFFDSHYAATALREDRKLISFDAAYDHVEGLQRVAPEQLVERG